METERGLNFSIRAVPRAGSGRTIQLVSELAGTPGPAKAGKSRTPMNRYWFRLIAPCVRAAYPMSISLSPSLLKCCRCPAGLRATADRVWVGHHLIVVRYSLDNVSLSARMVRESDFWQPGTRAVMFSTPAGLLTAGGRMQIWVTTSDEGVKR